MSRIAKNGSALEMLGQLMAMIRKGFRGRYLAVVLLVFGTSFILQFQMHHECQLSSYLQSRVIANDEVENLAYPWPLGKAVANV